MLEVACVASVPVRGKSFSRLLVARKLREKSTETGVLNAESFFLRTETLASQALLEVALRGVLLLKNRIKESLDDFNSRALKLIKFSLVFE